jgi:hypothetical protein
MTKTAKHFPQIARDVGGEHFLTDAGRGRDKNNEDEDDRHNQPGRADLRRPAPGDARAHNLPLLRGVTR